MAQATATKITLPPGRLVGGDLYTPNDKDAEGNPLTIKSGPNQGGKRVDYFAAYAIPKTPGKQWWEEQWGLTIYQTGATAFPQQCQSPKFAWKVEDGDSTVPNGKGKIPRERPGYAGHWIVKMSSGFQSPIYQAQSGQWVQQNTKDFVQPGDYIQAEITINGNGSQQQPGVFINHTQFAFLGHGQRIVLGGADPNKAGFAMGHLPPGASATPMAASMPMPVAPGAPAAPAPAPLIPGMVAAPAAPAAPAPMAPPPAPAAQAVPVLVQVPGAQYTIEACRQAGWTDDQIVAQGVATRAAPAPMAPPSAPAAPAMPTSPGVAPLPPGSSAPAPAAPAAQIAPAPGPAVTPNPAFANVPPAPSAPAAPAMPAGPQLTAAGLATGHTLDQFRQSGWTDADLRASGYIL